MGRRKKQSLKRRSKSHRASALTLRARKNRLKGKAKRHANRTKRRSGGKAKK